MFKKLLMNMSVLTLLGFGAGQAVAANIVQFVEPNPIETAGSTTLDLDLIGNFEDAVDAGAFTVNWDPAVIQYTGTAVANPPWDTATVSDDSAGTGVIDFIFLGKSVGTVTGLFDIATLSFDVIGGVGTSSAIEMADVFGGWSKPGGNNVPVNYTDGLVSVTVAEVPLPAAGWLMGSGLLCLFGAARRRRSA